jgi:hypothetical protein
MASSMIDAPAKTASAVVNGVSFAYAANQAVGLYIGVGGDVEVITAAGHTVMFKNCYSGQILPIRCSQCTANTTATYILALFQ